MGDHVEERTGENIQANGQESFHDRVQENFHERAQESFREIVQESIQASVHERVQDGFHERSQENFQEIAQESLHERAQQSFHERAQESFHERGHKSFHEIVQESIQENVPENELTEMLQDDNDTYKGSVHVKVEAAEDADIEGRLEEEENYPDGDIVDDEISKDAHRLQTIEVEVIKKSKLEALETNEDPPLEDILNEDEDIDDDEDDESDVVELMERVEDKLKCLICRTQLSEDASDKFISKEMKRWKEQCAETVCELLFHSELHPFKHYFQNAGYCNICQRKVWDVDFAWRKLVLLREKVDEISRSLRQDLIDNYWRVEHKSDGGLPDMELLNLTSPELRGTYSYDDVIEMIYKVQENAEFFDLTCEPDLQSLFTNPTSKSTKFKSHTSKRSNHKLFVKPKGKPGRPRKHFSPSEVVAPVPKRPRGRPRKYVTEEVTYIEDLNCESANVPEVPIFSDENDLEKETDGRRLLRRKASKKVSEVIEALLSDDQSDVDIIEGDDGAQFDDDDGEFLIASDTDFEYEEYLKEARRARKREKKARRKAMKALASTKEDEKRSPIVPMNRIACKVKGCDRHFIKESTMLLHVRRVHDGEKNPFLCVYCDRTFETRNEFRKHQYVHPEYNTKDYHFVRKSYKFACKVCSKGYDNEEELNIHNVVHQGPNPFVCCDCTGEFSNSVDLRTHIAEHHPEPDTPKCEVCGKIFSAMASKRIHMRIHLNPQELPKCPICPYTGYSQSALKNHMLTHSSERAFQCDTCGKTYKNVEGLRYHKRNHTGERPHICQLCGKGFRQSGHLKRHEEVHSGLKKHICSHCGKAWASIDNLKAHEKIHTRDPNNPVKGRTRKPKIQPVFKKIPYPMEVDSKDDSLSTHSANQDLDEYHQEPPNRYITLPLQAISSGASHSNNPSPTHVMSHSGALYSAPGQSSQLFQLGAHNQPIQVPNLMNFRTTAPPNFQQHHGFAYNNFNNPNF